MADHKKKKDIYLCKTLEELNKHSETPGTIQSHLVSQQAKQYIQLISLIIAG